MSYAPKKVFILENGKYVEISYEEHSKRKTNDPEYGEKYFILVDDILMEVSHDNYKSYHQYNEHEKYVTKRDKKKGCDGRAGYPWALASKGRYQLLE